MSKLRIITQVHIHVVLGLNIVTLLCIGTFHHIIYQITISGIVTIEPFIHKIVLASDIHETFISITEFYYAVVSLLFVRLLILDSVDCGAPY